MKKFWFFHNHNHNQLTQESSLCTFKYFIFCLLKGCHVNIFSWWMIFFNLRDIWFPYQIWNHTKCKYFHPNRIPRLLILIPQFSGSPLLPASLLQENNLWENKNAKKLTVVSEFLFLTKKTKCLLWDFVSFAWCI